MLNEGSKPDGLVFWGCFIALITTAFAFITRAFMINIPDMWPSDFNLDKVQAQTLFGHGIWPFAVSIILFSLVIDRIGYRAAMLFSFVCYAIYAALALYAYSIVKAEGLSGEDLVKARESGLRYLTWGSIVLGLGNGTVEAFINPVVATMYSHAKTKWLNILHAGWPGGLVLGGLITILLGSNATEDWRLLIYIIAIPAAIYLLMLIGAKFPINERVAGGATYKEMLAEFGAIGCLIASFLIVKQLADTFQLEKYLVENFDVAAADGAKYSLYVVYGVVAFATLVYGFYCQSLGRPLMIFLCLVMMPLATTELGTDGAITGIMEEPMKAMGHNPLWVLIYTSAIMMVLRFFVGPVVDKLTPLGLLATCAALAIVGLFLLSSAKSIGFIFAAATLYGIGKTYFWPTTLGVVSEQFPKGGALTLNAIAGIGMLAVGIIGGPLIGKMQEDSARAAVVASAEGQAKYDAIKRTDKFFLGSYEAVDESKVSALPAGESAEISGMIKEAKQGALAKVTVFPCFMLVCYLILLGYFKSRGGYRPSELARGGMH
jgi:MFS family permease